MKLSFVFISALVALVTAVPTLGEDGSTNILEAPAIADAAGIDCKECGAEYERCRKQVGFPCSLSENGTASNLTESTVRL
jgi:hypothetical protein